MAIIVLGATILQTLWWLIKGKANVIILSVIKLKAQLSNYLVATEKKKPILGQIPSSSKFRQAP